VEFLLEYRRRGRGNAAGECKQATEAA
jgi:hypothetical protein